MYAFEIVELGEHSIVDFVCFAGNLVPVARFIDQIWRKPSSADDQWIALSCAIVSEICRTRHADVGVGIAALECAVDENPMHSETHLKDEPVSNLLVKNTDVKAVSVKAIEGETVYGGELKVKPMLKGDEMTFLEINYTAGVGAPLHVHNHESLVYVVKGRVKTAVGENVFELGPGDVCRHPAGIPHSVEAMEDSVMVEIKAPAPDIANFFKL